MNWRAVGCGTLGAAIFVGVALFGILRAGAPAECPDRLPYEPAAYAPVGAPTSEPSLDGVEEPLERAGTASFGLAQWEVFVEPGFAPASSGEPLPQRIVLACGDGTYRAYHRAAE